MVAPGFSLMTSDANMYSNLSPGIKIPSLSTIPILLRRHQMLFLRQH